MRAYIKKNKSGEVYYIVQAGNGENIHTSESYKRKQSATKSIAKLFPQITEEHIFDQTKGE